jgi:hypothetical protein
VNKPPDFLANVFFLRRRFNPERLRSEAAFAQLCGTAPLPASSGRTTRHRLTVTQPRPARPARVGDLPERDHPADHTDPKRHPWLIRDPDTVLGTHVCPEVEW